MADCIPLGWEKQAELILYEDEMKTALVTGNTRGIGKALVEELSQHHYRVVGCSRNEANIANHHVCDVSDKEQVREFASKVKETYGRIDVLVNNAGGCSSQDYLFKDIPLEEWDQIINSNLNGVVYVTQAFLSLMQEGSAIVNISSTLTQTPMPGKSLYSASKAGIEVLTRNLALELAGEGIRVNCIQPGPTDTDLLKSHFMQEGEFNEEQYANLGNNVPLGRLCSPKDIAEAVYFLCNAPMITGQVLSVDGGRSLRW
jgi:NAD(P)-dependent dehydrogenase (short-subunit alcohol dehydrogenase family)